jgi:hypothetical protein
MEVKIYAYGFLSENLKGRDHLGDIGVDGSVLG